MSWAGPRIDVEAGEHLSHAVVRSMVRGVSYATYVVKATFEIVPGGAARIVAPEPVVLWDLHRTADPRSSLTAASETQPFLSNAAILMTGSAHHAHTGEDRSASAEPFRARLAVIASSGPLVDKFVLIQPRGAEPTPLIYEDARATRDNPAGSQWPRVVHAQNASEATGFGPIAASWPSRVELLRGAPPPPLRDGVIDCGAGVDARFFNPAPLDQQTPFLAGTETIVIEGVDSERPRLATHLGGVGITLTQSVVDSAGLEPRLDMLIIDTDRRRISLVWRAFSEPPHAVSELVVSAVFRSAHPVAERSAPAQVAHGRKVYTTVDIPHGTAKRDATLPFTTPRLDSVPEVKPSPASTNRGRVDPAAKRRLQETMPTDVPLPLKSAMPFQPSPVVSERSASPLIPATPYDPSFVPQSVKPVPVGLRVTRDITPAQQEEVAVLLNAQALATSAEPTQSTSPAAPMFIVGQPLGAPVEAASPILDHGPGAAEPLPTVPAEVAEPVASVVAPQDDRGDPLRASLLLRLKEKGAPRDMDLSNADLSDLDLTGLSFSGSKLDGANLSRSSLRQTNLAGVSMKRARLESATLDTADLTGATLTNAIFDEASFAGARLSRADLSNSSGRAASFAGAHCERAKLTGGSFEGGIFTKANLLESDWTKARAGSADFSNAKLEGATLVQLSADRANFSGCDLTRADLTRAALATAVFDEASAPGANFEQASLVKARLDRARLAGGRFSKASLDEASFVDADLTGADFSKCAGPGAKLAGALLDDANLKQANFSNASFSNAKLRRANLGRGTFLAATFDGADLTLSDAREAKLAGASMRGANLTTADFRDADLSNAKMGDAILVDTKLKGAKR